MTSDTIQIVTTYHGPVGLRGSRITAQAHTVDGSRRTSVPYDHAAHDPHLSAAQALAAKLGYDPETIEYVATHNGPGNTYRARRPQSDND